MLPEIQAVVMSAGQPACRALGQWLGQHGLAWRYGSQDYGIDAARNQNVRRFLADDVPRGKTFLLMIDHDMVPSVSFFDHAVKFLNEYHGPTVIGSPYCGAAPDCEVQVCEQDQNGIVRRVTHDEAAERHGTRPTMMVGTVSGFLANSRSSACSCQKLSQAGCSETFFQKPNDSRPACRA